MVTLAAALLAVLLAAPARGADVAFEQRLGARVPADARFRDEAGGAVTLARAAGGRPTVLMPVYLRCEVLCPETLNGLVRVLRSLPAQPGRDFSVVVLSIDPRETPAAAAAKKAWTLTRYGRGGAGWSFLTGSERSIRAVTDAIGFRYERDPRTGDFAHAAGFVVLTPDGRVSRYFFGVEFPAGDLETALRDAGGGGIGARVAALLLECLRGDPLPGTPAWKILRALRVAGAATVLALAVLVAALLRRERPGEAA